ncbi:hypothetical protein [uncultured Gammaproteobacteria bacterium]|nr:hypothetical protein [uncultured Gammaproteobacteria bacterium]
MSLIFAVTPFVIKLHSWFNFLFQYHILGKNISSNLKNKLYYFWGRGYEKFLEYPEINLNIYI